MKRFITFVSIVGAFLANTAMADVALDVTCKALNGEEAHKISGILTEDQFAVSKFQVNPSIFDPGVLVNGKPAQKMYQVQDFTLNKGQYKPRNPKKAGFRKFVVSDGSEYVETNWVDYVHYAYEIYFPSHQELVKTLKELADKRAENGYVYSAIINSDTFVYYRDDWVKDEFALFNYTCFFGAKHLDLK